MKLKVFSLAVAITTICAVGFNSCSKSSSGGGTTDSGTDAATQADDQSYYSIESDDATNDADASISTYSGSYNARPEGVFTWPCDASSTVIKDTIGSTASITITYTGTTCGLIPYHKRTGTITVSYDTAQKWSDTGSVVTITFDLTSTRLFDNKVMTLTGTRTITNVYGGLLPALSGSDSIVRSIADNMTITFNNGSQRTWQTSLHRVFTYDNGLVSTTSGSTSGTNRFGNSFSATITGLVVEQCSDFRYTAGTVSFTGGGGGTSTTTFGLDSALTGPVSDCTTGAIWFAFSWVGPNGGTYKTSGSY